MRRQHEAQGEEPLRVVRVVRQEDGEGVGVARLLHAAVVLLEGREGGGPLEGEPLGAAGGVRALGSWREERRGMLCLSASRVLTPNASDPIYT